MMLAVLILILSTAMIFFYFQATCQNILREQFNRKCFRSIVNAHGLEFVALQSALGDTGTAVDYRQLREMLKCDYLALTYLLKTVANAKQHTSTNERLLIVYFHWLSFSLAARCLLGVGEKQAIRRLASVLEYFANVLGQRANADGFRNLTAADHLINR